MAVEPEIRKFVVDYDPKGDRIFIQMPESRTSQNYISAFSAATHLSQVIHDEAYLSVGKPRQFVIEPTAAFDKEEKRPASRLHGLAPLLQETAKTGTDLSARSFAITEIRDKIPREYFR